MGKIQITVDWCGLVACRGSIGFNGLAWLDSMVARLTSVVGLSGCWVGLGGGFRARQN